VIKKPRERGGHSPRWAAEPEKIIVIIIIIIIIVAMCMCVFVYGTLQVGDVTSLWWLRCTGKGRSGGKSPGIP
jgi:hypothetical protein